MCIHMRDMVRVLQVRGQLAEGGCLLPHRGSQGARDPTQVRVSMCHCAISMATLIVCGFALLCLASKTLTNRMLVLPGERFYLFLPILPEYCILFMFSKFHL